MYLEEILSSTTIRPDSLASLQLSPNDWLIPSSSTIDCIYFYRLHQWSACQKQDSLVFMNAERLLVSLRKLLEYYPFLTGVLKRFGKDNKVSIEHDAGVGGVLFISTSVNIPLSNLPITAEEYTDINKIPMSLQLINRTDGSSLFHVRHTRFACGSVALGISLNHQVADAHSYFQLVNQWARLYTDAEYQPDVCHQRSLLQPSLEEIQQLKHSNPDFNHRRSLCYNPPTSLSIPPPKETAIKVFQFSADELQRMKSDATAHLPPDVAYLSTFEVLTAHLYRHVMLARQPSIPSATTTTRLYISTNIRPRLTSTFLPSTYFGNAIMFSYCEMPMAELLAANDLGSIAGKVHRAIKDNTKTDIRTSLAWTECQEDKTKITPSWNLVQTDFTISAWNKMGMYANGDFERGVRPCRIALPPNMTSNGGANYLSTEKEDESIEVVLGLEVNEMDRLEKDADFRKYSRQ